MRVLHGRKGTQAALRKIGARRTSAPPENGSTRDNLARRSKRVDDECPSALDVEARILDRARPHVRGVVSLISGSIDEDKMRAMLHGDLRSIPTYVWCRWARSLRPEAGAAVDELLEVLAEERGRQLGPRAIPAADLVATLPEMAEDLARLMREVTVAAKDGKYTAKELAGIRKAIRAQLERTNRALAKVSQLEGRLKERS